MKIVTREAFLQLPENTVFIKYESGRPLDIGDLMIKMQTLPIRHPVVTSDFIYKDLVAVSAASSDDLLDAMVAAETEGKVLRLDGDSTSRDGLYDIYQLFLVFDSDDVAVLINSLQACLLGNPECVCGGVDRPHRIADPGCFRKMVARAPVRMVDESRWMVDGTEVTDFTLRHQLGYAKHECGRWSRFATDDNSPC